MILCILKGEMPFKMHKIIFFPDFFLKKMCLPTLSLNFIFFIWPKHWDDCSFVLG